MDAERIDSRQAGTEAPRKTTLRRVLMTSLDEVELPNKLREQICENFERYLCLAMSHTEIVFPSFSEPSPVHVALVEFFKPANCPPDAYMTVLGFWREADGEMRSGWCFLGEEGFYHCDNSELMEPQPALWCEEPFPPEALIPEPKPNAGGEL